MHDLLNINNHFYFRRLPLQDSTFLLQMHAQISNRGVDLKLDDENKLQGQIERVKKMLNHVTESERVNA